ncbi:MAG TPA: aminotransferase class IV [Actinomycetaceae bacterium]|nr:aminotransferase class IV [Actinomycetaceae bacterium]
MTGVIWHEGEIHAATARVVSGADRGFLLGHGVFTTCGLLDGHPFALTRHLRRLTDNAERIGLPAPPRDDIRGAVAALSSHLGPVEGRMRITWAAGPQDHGSLLVSAAPGISHGQPAQRAVTLPWTHNERSPLSGVKSLSFGANLLGLADAQRRGADEGILLNTRGDVCEATMSNLVFEMDGTLVTPPLSSGCLPGITRELLLEWAPAAGLEIEERPVSGETLRDVPHAALTSSLRGVMPLSGIDERELTEGPLISRLARMYDERRRQHVDP